MAATPEQLYEQMLVVRSQIGDEIAFGELLDRHGPRLLAFTQRMMQSAPNDVADLTQEIWVAIYRALPGLQDPSKFRPWAFRIARDRIYGEYRRRKLPVESMEPTQVEDLPEEREEPIDTEVLQRCLDKLSPEHRETLVLRFFEEMSYEDIARITGATLGTVRSRIHYARQALKKSWKGQII